MIAGVRRGESTVIISFGRAVKLWMGVDPTSLPEGHDRIGGVVVVVVEVDLRSMTGRVC